MVFHEITRPAIEEALANPRDIDERPGRGAGGAPHPRPAVRLRGLAGAVEEGAPGSRPAACSRSPCGWSWSASASACASAPPTTGTSTRRSRRATGGDSFGARLAELDGRRVATGRDFDPRPARSSQEGRAVLLDEARRASARRAARRGPASVWSRSTSGRSRSAPAAVHHLHAAAGGRAQAALHRAAHDAGGAAALRERLHHLHAHRQHEPVARQALDAARRRPRAVRREYLPDEPRRYAAKQGRAGGARGDPPRRRRRFRTPERGARELDADASASTT
jgi:DNA topoisomerase I